MRSKILIFTFALANISLTPEESFILFDGRSQKEVLLLGSRVDEPISPCSTFKLPLCLMGFDSGVLRDEHHPVWSFKEGYDDFLPCWKTTQNPKSWIKNSCVWYSRLIVDELGVDLFNHYLKIFEYGNQDLTGGFRGAWLSSSLKISPREQLNFIKKMIEEELPVSSDTIKLSKPLFFLEELEGGWKLFGKTGFGVMHLDSSKNELGWFVGWIEKEGDWLAFAYLINDEKIDLQKRVPRVKELLRGNL
jgi:beta-lactamase class D